MLKTRPRRKIPAALATRIRLRDGSRCVYCLAAESKRVKLTMDHVTVHCEDGADSPNNLVTACLRCNTLRGVNDIDLFAEWLRRRGIGDDGICARVLRAISLPLPELPAPKRGRK